MGLLLPQLRILFISSSSSICCWCLPLAAAKSPRVRNRRFAVAAEGGDCWWPVQMTKKTAAGAAAAPAPPSSAYSRAKRGRSVGAADGRRAGTTAADISSDEEGRDKKKSPTVAAPVSISPSLHCLSEIPPPISRFTRGENDSLLESGLGIFCGIDQERLFCCTHSCFTRAPKCVPKRRIHRAPLFWGRFSACTSDVRLLSHSPVLPFSSQSLLRHCRSRCRRA